MSDHEVDPGVPGVPVYIRAIDADDLTHHHAQHVYEATTPCPIWSETRDGPVLCQLTTNINESFIWCEECGHSSQWTQLRKSYQAQGIAFAQVWQDTDTINLTTGRVETDARKFKVKLWEESRKAEERLGMPVCYEPIDLTDRDALGITDEGMDSTHDAAVRDGRKDSRGRFVF